MRQLPEKKANLIERLQSNDRNKNFGVDCEIQEEIAYLSPATDTFRDIIADTSLPMITRQAIQEYFERYNTQHKGQLLYEFRHLVTARYSTDGIYTHLRGQCKASMKKMTCEPANPHGIEWDRYTYVDRTPIDILLEKLLLKILYLNKFRK
ncbi:uncharacterized protein LOC119193801 isoform X1 [Manduca sexta]|uniref:uncharacterized protein LOC119189337 isoform X2 n=1 Tax=Manduca sexta TaxID=7130 RepID=UPI00188EB229|nr:uncharacterized protein LOC119189337 isoform X2 [Manduca sexta]XP_037299751.1 uncharacterized protein LOC119188544 isoform X1 [Manduca sexta]XP_037302401.1 uncharacterized protein LOC119192742 isoform X1 [Manduca sexta]XP_037303426.1 uncharacterized protein LOC119193801 isoform X1 [Manduca sexta]